MTQQQHPFEGMVLIPTQQLADIVKVMVVAGIKEELDRREAASASNPADALPDEVPAAQAAKFLGYKTGNSLRQWHQTDLTPMRNGKRLFYKKGEVVKLKKKLFNQ